MFLFLGLFLSILHASSAIIAYDCGAEALNLTTVSLLDVGNCDLPVDAVKEEKIEIQLLQIAEFTTVDVIQCAIVVDRTIYDCSIWNYLMPTAQGRQEYIHNIGRADCEDLYKNGTIIFQGRKFSDIVRNSTTTVGVDLVGDGKKNCKGGYYSDLFGAWNNVYVQAILKFKVSKHAAKINMNTNMIHLKSGTVCELNQNTCMDLEYGWSFWNPFEKVGCKTGNYQVLFDGLVTKSTNKIVYSKGIDTERKRETIYSLNSKDTTFSLIAKDSIKACGYTIINTEHPKLKIYERDGGPGFPYYYNIVENVDIFTYVNSKFIYVERHIGDQMQEMYRRIVENRCLLEQEVQKNALALATVAPDQYAYNLMKSPGYMAITSGEVIHIVKCLPVEVKPAQSETCYNQLQVTRNNQTMFMTPKTHVLMKHGVEIPCNSMLPSYYKMNDIWYKIMPRPIETTPPMVMSPYTKDDFKYQSALELATSGIYSEQDLNMLRDQINFPMERPSVLNEFIRGLMGHPTNNGGRLVNMLDEEALESLAENSWSKLWDKFMTFGNVSAGIIAMMVILQIIKLLLDTVVRGYTLHKIYGWSITLLAAIFASITTLCLYMGRNREDEEKPEPAETQRMITNTQPEPTRGDIQTSVENEVVKRNDSLSFQPTS